MNSNRGQLGIIGVILAWLTLSVRIAGANDLEWPECAANPPVPDIEVRVPGFPGERLYLHPKHPRLCKPGEPGCESAAYVLTGDELLSTSNCEGWALATFKGAQQTTTGWIPTRRLPEHYEELYIVQLRARGQDANPAEVPTPSTNAACIAAQTRLNDAITEGDAYLPQALPAATDNKHEVDELPGGRNSHQRLFWSATKSDARIEGHPLTVFSFENGGTCHQGNVELWTPDLKRRIPVKGSNVDPEHEEWDTGYSSESLVQLAGRAYLAHISRSHNVTLYGFDDQLTAYPACELKLEPPAHERIRSAIDPAMCRAVLAEQVSGLRIEDVDPIPVANDPFSPEIIARGKVDVDNDGTPDNVAIIQLSEDGGGGCGHEYRSQWPVKVGGNGMPSPATPFNEQSAKIAGQHHESRLFTYHGATYLERRSLPNDDGVLEHDVWKFTPNGAVQACLFQAAEYHALDVTREP